MKSQDPNAIQRSQGLVSDQQVETALAEIYGKFLVIGKFLK